MNEPSTHYKKLERMYLSAPINTQLYNGVTIAISHEKAELTLMVKEKFFHAASAIHGSVYFKMLDDAAFFAVNSIVEDVFVYTVSFKHSTLTSGFKRNNKVYWRAEVQINESIYGGFLFI